MFILKLRLISKALDFIILGQLEIRVLNAFDYSFDTVSSELNGYCFFTSEPWVVTISSITNCLNYDELICLF